MVPVEDMMSSHELVRRFAVEAIDHGLSVLPAHRDGATKRPALPSWKEYQHRVPSLEEIDSWFTQDISAVCIVCGAASGNVEVIDFDCGGSLFAPWSDEVRFCSPGLLERLVIERTPSGGVHVWYRCPEAVDGNRKLAWVGDSGGAGAVAIETRGEGGVCLCAPSDGYVIEQGSLLELPAISAEERETLLVCASMLSERRLSPVVTGGEQMDRIVGGRPGDDFNRRGDVRRMLVDHGWTLTRPGENEHWCRPGKSSGTSATLKDGILYVFTSNAPPFEPSKAYAPFGVFALLEHGGSFSAAAAALRAQGFGASDGPPERPLTGPSCEPSASRVVAPCFRYVTELRTKFPALRQPVIHGLLREGETMNLIAASKMGKSWLALDLALCVAGGASWLGRFSTEPGEVLIIDNELHPETSASRVGGVADARGIDLAQVGGRVAIENLRGRLCDLDEMSGYFGMIEPRQFRLIILDALYRFLPEGGDENDNAMIASMYNLLDGFADRLGCAFVLVHHTSKGGQASKGVTDVGAGAGSQSRAADTHLVLRSHQEANCVALGAVARSFPPIDPVGLRWSFPVWNHDAALDATQLRGEYSRPTRSQSERGAERALTTERFVDTFCDQPRTRDEIALLATKQGVSGRKAKQHIQAAITGGLLSESQYDGRSAPRLSRTSMPDARARGGAA